MVTLLDFGIGNRCAVVQIPGKELRKRFTKAKGVYENSG